MRFAFNPFVKNLDLVNKAEDFYSSFFRLDQTTPQTITGLSDGFLSLTSGVIGTSTVDLTPYVPYTGATTTVNLSTADLITSARYHEVRIVT